HSHTTTSSPHSLHDALPIFAAVNGPAAGAGLSLALACDLRIAADSASFVPAFVSIGLVPDSGGTFFARRLLGYARAFDWLATGRDRKSTRLNSSHDQISYAV